MPDKKQKRLRRNARETFTQLIRDRLFIVTSVISIFFLVITIALPIWRLFPSLKGQPGIPLHYNIHFGVDLLGPWWQIFSIPGYYLLAIIVNILLAWYYVRREPVLSKFFLALMPLLGCFFFIGMIFTVLLIIDYGY